MASIAVDKTLIASEPHPAGLSDAALMQRFARTRDEQAFEQIVVRYEPLVMGVCRRHLRCQQDVEDAFQATFLVLAAKAGRVRWQPSIANWLYGVSRRIALKARMKRAKREAQEVALMEPIARDELNEVANHYAAQLLDEELCRLPERYRAPLVLCYLDGRSRREAAEALGCSEAAIKGRLERGRRKLRMRLMVRGLSFSIAVAALHTSQQFTAAVTTSSLVGSTVAAATAFSTGGHLAGSIAQQAISLAKGELMMTTASLLRYAALIVLTISAVSWALLAATAPAAVGRQQAVTIYLSSGGDGEGNFALNTFFTTAGGAADVDPAAKLAGDWTIESASDGGKAISAEKLAQMHCVISGKFDDLLRQ